MAWWHLTLKSAVARRDAHVFQKGQVLLDQRYGTVDAVRHAVVFPWCTGF